ncbi:MAG: AAA family ATPase [Myxococcota bacterium]|jgi:predicted ATPase|nr:AAA family ATPase [Myxococcota bacterium]
MSDGLRELHITGFASLADVRLRPGRLTVLIGPNAAGKSNILRALRMVPLMLTGSLQRFVGEAGGAAALLHYGPKHSQTLALRLDFVQGERCNVYEAQLGFAAGDRLLYLDESVGYQPTPDAELRTTSLGAGHWESGLRSARASDATARAVHDWLSQLTFFHFHDTSMSSALRTHARAEDDPFLRSDGSNLAAYLRRLEQSEDEAEGKAWRRINHFVSRIAPAVKVLAPTLVNGNAVRLDWIDDHDERFGAHQLSDGTLRAIALITAFAQPTAQLPKFMCIDEPELGLHPSAIRVLAELARSVSRHTQVLFATQSTAFLDHFEPSEVVVVEREDGASTLRRYDEASLASWLEDYSLSEVFDKGVIGGRP